jgi:diaminopimelate epimerase
MADTVPYRRMSGLGNDFVVLDARDHPIRPTGDQVRWISDRELGVGCDQLIVLERAKTAGADLFMRIFNAEGFEVDACGNATRCIGAMLTDELGRKKTVVETNAGLLISFRDSDTVTVDMGAPKFGWRDIPLSEEFLDTRGIELQIGPVDAPILHTPSVVNVGNPHAIFWVNDLEKYDLGRFGPLLENHPLFPQRANISLAHVTDPAHIEIKVWERGAGLTKACGTAACAVAVAAARKGLADRQVTISLPGGALEIEWRKSDDHMLMAGPFSFDGAGELGAEMFLDPAE